MPESILNFTKSLEILFDTRPDGATKDDKGSRDRIRGGLQGIGIAPNLIEDVFVRVAILRNEFDVGHGRLALHDLADLQLIYRFVIMAEFEFRKLFQHIVRGVSAGTLTLPKYEPNSDTAYSKPLRGVIDALRQKFG